MAINWDKSGMRTTQSNLAKAEAESGHVRLDFGISTASEAGDLREVELLRRVLLQPEAASNLVKLLNTLISKQNQS